MTVHTRWYIWASIMAVFIIGYFHRVAPAVLAEDLARTFRVSGVALGGLSSIYFYIYAFMQIPSGICADTIGPRKTVTAGAVVMGLGSILFGLAPTLPLCFAGRFLVGLGVSVLMVNIMRICVEWFRPDEMGIMNGLTTALGAIGGLLAAVPLAYLDHAIGWRTSFSVIGVLVLVLAWNCWRVVRDRPADCGLPGAGTCLATDLVPEVPPQRSIAAALVTVLTNRHTWPPFFGFFAIYSTLMAFTGLWGVPYLAQVYGLSNQQAASYVMVTSLGLVMGCPVVGWISDRLLLRRKLPYAVWTSIYLAVWAVLCFAGEGKPPLSWMYVLCFCLGFFSSGFILSIITAKELNPLDISGIAMGTCNTSGFLASAILQVVLGKVLDLHWDGTLVNGVRVYPLDGFRAAFLVCLGLAVVAFIATLLLKETRCKNLRAHPTPRATGRDEIT